MRSKRVVVLLTDILFNLLVESKRGFIHIFEIERYFII